jgi:hypothetical protein
MAPTVSDPSLRAAAEAIIPLLDFDRPELASWKALADRREDAALLRLFRERVISNLRMLNLGEFNYHEVHLKPAYVAEAELLIGKWTPVEYSDAFEGRAWGKGTKGSLVASPEQYAWLVAAGIMAPPGTKIEWFLCGPPTFGSYATSFT